MFEAHRFEIFPAYKNEAVDEGHTAYIGVGSNLKDPLLQCKKAVTLLDSLYSTEVMAVSSYYRSEPLVIKGQNPSQIPWYVNAVCQIRTGLSPSSLLDAIKNIEKKMGRKPSLKWGSRLIDLDLLMYGDMVVHSPHLVLPHPQMKERPFVLEPFCEIAPHFKHPVFGKSMANLAGKARGSLHIEKV